MYLIRYQGPQWFEPLTYFGNNTLKDVYDYVPTGTKRLETGICFIAMGEQGSMWDGILQVSRKMWIIFCSPRLAAVAEAAWTQPEKKDWASFLQAMHRYNGHIAEKGIGLCPFDVQYSA